MDIKSVIKKYGETTYTVAEKMGIAQPSVMQYINGNPTARKLEDIARAIGCSPPEFFADWQGPLKAEAEQPAPQPEASNTEASAPQTATAQADALPFTEEPAQQPDLTADIAFICPHCHEAIKLGFIK